MRLGRKLWFAALMAFVAVSVVALAQMGRSHMYDSSKERTVSGTVSKVTTMQGMGGMGGVHLDVQSEGKTWDVHVGPASYVEKNGFKFEEGDHVEVVGAEMMMGGSSALIAREITKDGKTLTLRDNKGVPKWSGGQGMGMRGQGGTASTDGSCCAK